jgi:hypothetical protein
MNYYEIDERQAKIAKSMNSFYDYEENSETENYKNMVDEAMKIANDKKSKVDAIYHEKIDNLIDVYAKKLSKNINDRNLIDSRCPSVLIVGGGNFPNGKKAKQNIARDKNYKEFNEIQSLLNKIKTIGTGGIKSDDPGAIEKLKIKLERLEANHAEMKMINAYYRKNKTLDGCPNIDEEIINNFNDSVSRGLYANPKPFQSFSLANSSAEIKRIKSRIDSLEANKKIPDNSGWTFDSGTVVFNSEIDRVQIFYNEKPSEELRSKLKSNGFKFAPSQNNAWQRQLTNNGIYSAKKMTQEVTR